MKIIVPAYNVKPEQAARYEAQIAEIMHRNRNIERNTLAHLPDDSPMREANKARHGVGPPPQQKERPLVPTDIVIMAALTGKKLTSTEIMKATGIKRDTIRAALLRLSSRGLIIKEVRGNHITWHKMGKQEHAEEN